MNKHLLSLSLFLLAGLFVKAADFVLYHDHQVVPVVLIDGADDPVMAAANLFKDDYQSVTGQMPTILNKADGFNLKVPCVLVGTVGKNKTFDKFLALNHVETTVLMKHPEAFRLQVLGTTQNQFLLILGSDPHGTAYGLLELSRFIGVSPWIWWADATPVKQTSLIFPSGNIIQQYPSVRYRGIFINDEDWGLMPWATKTLQPDCRAGAVGPEAYERVCQLLLRLRANLLWPAMHACTTPFFFVAGNADMAKRYGIYLGSSHCEPFLCNIHGEWDRKRLGDYNYATNADTVLAYWRARVEQTKDMPTIYTIGMRGEHDEKMQGANTVDEQKILLQRVLDDQRRMLQEATGKQPEIVPQVFVPYKEVLDVYDAGLKVPEDVTLIWCDDNYGYISRLSNTEEALRSGGAGVYYHISYWGRPHDYLWLATTTPALIRFEMNRAWEKGARKLWVLNVGDIKPGEYLTEYFMDMAWSLGEDSLTTIQPSDSNELPYTKHLNAFMSREFGADNAATLTSVMQRFYQLATIRKPEHMGWDKVEEPDYPKGFTPLVDTEFSQKEIDSRLQAYAVLENQVRTIEERLPGDKRAAYFQLVAYPVYGASLLNQKILYAQLARQFESNDSLKAVTYAAASLFAYQEIKRLTAYYNVTMSNGKWNFMMCDHPRNLFVFDAPHLPESFIDIQPKPILTPRVVLRSAEINQLQSSGSAAKKAAVNGDQSVSTSVSATCWALTETDSCVAFNASVAFPDRPLSGLGHSGSAICLKKGERATYSFETVTNGSARLGIYSLPDHAADGGDIRYQVVLDKMDPVVMNTRTFGRSMEWKENVLRNQAVRWMPVSLLKPGLHTLTITALDDDVVLDQLQIQFSRNRRQYLVVH